jgi:DNA recombination protein RmuC
MNVTEQLKNLQDILKNPKQRGILGEYYLETVLKNVLPPGQYQMQYPFRDGTIVDAAIFYQEKIIPVDSKFSLENYNRILSAGNDEDRRRSEESLRSDIKTRIDETSKYIKPDENTFEFAFMFIPSEGLYYDILINKVGSVTARDLITYAAEKKVFIVSPTSFLAYLQTVIQGLKQVEFNKSAEQIRKNVGELGRHLSTYESYMKKLGGHLGTSVSMYNQAYKELTKIDKDIMRVSGSAPGIEIQQLSKPEEEEE